MKTLTLFSHFFRQFTLGGTTPTPHLERRTEFEGALRQYKPSPQTIGILAHTKLVPLIAPTASGRNTIINELLKTGHYHFIVSDTTRPPRMNNGIWEQEGREYFFRQEDEMLDDIKEGRFVEAELIHGQQVSGISAREFERAHQEGKIAITDVDIEGGINLARLKPDAITICVLPPSFGAWLTRIKSREHIEPINLHRRLRQATKVLKLALAHDHFIFVINDNLSDAVSTVDEIATRGVHHTEDEQKARKLAEHLYTKAKEYLGRHAPELSSY